MLFYHNTGGGEDFHAGGNIFQKIFPPGGEDITGGIFTFTPGKTNSHKKQIETIHPKISFEQ